MADIEALNRGLRIILLDDGKTYPITNSFDNSGNDCDPDAAEFAVAGPDSDGSGPRSSPDLIPTGIICPNASSAQFMAAAFF